MKTKLALACFVALSFGLFAIPAQAHGFNDYDHNHDGKWDKREFYDWHHHHPHCPPDHALDRRFSRYDRNHDGYLSREEARHFVR